MKRLYYHLRLLEPVIATALEGDPNSAVSFDHIPGSVLRGALIGLFMRQHTHLDVADDAIRRVFFSPNTQYLNAYPLVNGVRSLPVPKSWSTEKGKATPITDSVWTNEIFATGTSGFATVADGKFTKASVNRFIAVHTERDRRKGRSVEGSGALYRYDSLVAEQVFAGMILCEHDDAVYLSRYVKDGMEIRIGGARSAGYGHVVFENVQMDDYTEVESHFEDGQPFVVTLLSDALLRNHNGEYEPNVATLQNAIARHLNIDSSDVGEARKAFLDTTFIGGFNRKWGLPLPQTVALKMGSTVMFIDHNLDHAQVVALMQSGIGERRAEGFGRVGGNIYTEEQYTLAEIDKDKTSGDTKAIMLYGRLSPELARRKLRQLLDDQIIEEANAITVKNLPRSSQINALRQVIQNNPTELDEKLDHIGKRAATRRQFDKARIGGMNLIEWVRKTNAAQDKLNDPLIATLLERSGNPIQKEHTRYNLRLIDAVLARATKQVQKKGKD